MVTAGAFVAVECQYSPFVIVLWRYRSIKTHTPPYAMSWVKEALAKNEQARAAAPASGGVSSLGVDWMHEAKKHHASVADQVRHPPHASEHTSISFSSHCPMTTHDH